MTSNVTSLQFLDCVVSLFFGILTRKPFFQFWGISSPLQILLRSLYKAFSDTLFPGWTASDGILSTPAAFPILRLLMHDLISALEMLSVIIGRSPGCRTGGFTGGGRLSTSSK